MAARQVDSAAAAAAARQQEAYGTLTRMIYRSIVNIAAGWCAPILVDIARFSPPLAARCLCLVSASERQIQLVRVVGVCVLRNR